MSTFVASFSYLKLKHFVQEGRLSHATLLRLCDLVGILSQFQRPLLGIFPSPLFFEFFVDFLENYIECTSESEREKCILSFTIQAAWHGIDTLLVYNALIILQKNFQQEELKRAPQPMQCFRLFIFVLLIYFALLPFLKITAT